MTYHSPFRTFFLTAGAVALMACGSSGTTATDDTASTTGGSGATTTAESSTSVSNAVPDDVVLSSPTASASASANLAVGKSVLKVTGDADGEDFEAKREAIQALIAGTGECSFTFEFPTVTQPNCYGPTLTYFNHPEASAKDADSTNNDSGFNDTDGDGSLPSGDLGFWDAEEGTQACAAAQMNYLVGKVASKVDNATSLFAAMACAGKKAELELPAVGASVNMKTAMDTYVSVSGMTISTATLARLTDNSDGDAVYRSTLEISVTVQGGGGSTTQTGELVLTHVITNADDSTTTANEETYKGKIAMAMRQSTGSVGGCDGSLNGVTSAGVIEYEKESATVLRQELNYGEFCGGTTDVFDDNYDIDPDNKADVSNPGGWAANWHFGRFVVNPSNGTGTVAYAWQAGDNDGATRVMDVAVEEAADGSASGTAYFGYGPDVGADSGVGTITGFYCNWAGPQNRSTYASKAQRQVLARAAGATDYTASSSNLRYAISNSCDSTGNDGSGNSFGFSTSTTTTVMDNDTSPGTAVTNNMVDLTDVSFTVPEAPASL